MTTTIFYFSGSGNSLAVAKSIGSKIGNCVLKPIVRALAEKDFRIETEQVGFIFPLYYVGAPKIIQEFIREVDLTKASYIFAVVTKRWPVVGGAFDQLNQLLKPKNRKLDAGIYIKMPSNDITLTKVDLPAIQKRLLGKSTTKIIQTSEIISASRRKRDLEPLWFLWQVRNSPFIARVNQEDRFYSAGLDCNGCGSCAKVCPKDNIIIVDQKPQWQGRCEQCLACYHFCPRKTIYYKGRQANGIQYHHPEVNFTEISGQKINSK